MLTKDAHLTSGNKTNDVIIIYINLQEMFVSLRGPAFEVQVGLHELLGHGSGKLFQQVRV